MVLSDLGEQGLIDRLRSIVGEPEEGEVWIGDDAAVIRAPAGTIFFTTDMLVEGVHFDLELTSPEDLGFKAIAVSVSDIAAMGGTPRRAVVGAGLRTNMEVEWIERLFKGMKQCADAYRMALVGGDVSRSDCLVLSVAMLGNPAGRRVIERSGARVGDVVCVTGVLGASGAGYRLLRSGDTSRPDLLQAHLRPTPRVAEVELLRKQLPTAMIDISDGFAIDLHRLCEESKVGAVIDAGSLPLVDLAGLDLDRSPMDLALSGGEDYELCFTIPPDRAEAATAVVAEKTGTIITVVGEITEAGDGIRIRSEDGEVELERRGWDHLKA